MKTLRNHILASTLVATILSACGSRPVTAPNFSANTNPNQKSLDQGAGASDDFVVAPKLELAPDSPTALLAYARQLVITLAGRPLTAAERATISKDGKDAIKPLIKTWLESSFFPEAFRARVDMMLSTSGKRNDVDMNLPGNLAAFIARQKLPIETLLTADYCVDASGAKTKCDTGAPYAAGVLSTRGYLVGHAGRFNLGRANSMMSSFACTHYPMSTSLQPPTPKDELIPNFQVETKEESAMNDAGSFGNGDACYACHGQFSAHAQLFVKFDASGIYKAEATGAQSKTLEFGKSDNNLYTSHFAASPRMGDEQSNMFGTEVQDLAAAAAVLAKSQNFKECMTGKIITHGLNLDSEAASKLNAKALTEIVKGIPANNASVIDFYLAILSNPLVMEAYAKSIGDEP